MNSRLLVTAFVSVLLGACATPPSDSPSQQGTDLGIVLAARRGDVGAITRLIRGGASPSTTGPHHVPVLSEAAGEGHIEAVRLLIAEGANIGARDDIGCTPLFYAASPQIAELLLAKGADIDAHDGVGDTALGSHAFKGKTDVMSLLIAKGAKIEGSNIAGSNTPLLGATSGGHVESVKLLLRHHANVNARWSNGATALHAAKNPETAAALIEAGIDINAQDRNKATPLHHAAHWGKDSVAEFLIGWHARLESRSLEGLTPLHEAALMGQVGVANLLLTNGANVNAVTNLGSTALHLAAREGHADVVRLLLFRKANPTLRDRDEKTALALAKAKGHQSIVDQLERLGDR